MYCTHCTHCVLYTLYTLYCTQCTHCVLRRNRFLLRCDCCIFISTKELLQKEAELESSPVPGPHPPQHLQSLINLFGVRWFVCQHLFETLVANYCLYTKSQLSISNRTGSTGPSVHIWRQRVKLGCDDYKIAEWNDNIIQHSLSHLPLLGRFLFTGLQ